jgi:hypothetical protein
MRVATLLLPIVAVLFTSSAQAAPSAAEQATLACVAKAEGAGSGLACFGAIYAACVKPANADDAACGARELAFWQSQMDKAWKDAKPEIDGYAELKPDQLAAQKAFDTYRMKSCAIADKVDPGTMPGRSALCRAEITAQRALLLRRIAYSLGEH